MTAPLDNRTAVALAASKVDEAVALLQASLTLVHGVVGAGHDVSFTIADARRAAQVASAKLEILAKRVP